MQRMVGHGAQGCHPTERPAPVGGPRLQGRVALRKVSGAPDRRVAGVVVASGSTVAGWDRSSNPSARSVRAPTGVAGW